MATGLAVLTLVHVVISLIGIVSGLVVTSGLLRSQRMDGLTALFLVTTVATSATGFLFPFHKLLPSHILGAISLVALAIAIVARYAKQMARGWRRTYVIFAMMAFYLNAFVLVAQLFMKVPALHALAPTQSEPPFAITQVILLIFFLAVSILAAVRFRESATISA